MRSAIESRISRRKFEDVKIGKLEQEKITSRISELNTLSGLTMEFLEDGSRAFQNIRKSYGIFTNVRSLVLMKGKRNDENLKEKIGYFGEDLVLSMTELGLGTCWVGGTFDKDSFQIESDEELTCVIVVGSVSSASLSEKMVRATMRRKTFKISDRVTSDQPIPSWLEDGMHAVLLAPSAKNTQKPKFTYENNILSANVADDYAMDLIDLGIAKKHFEIEAGGRFEFGNGGVFHLNQ